MKNKEYYNIDMTQVFLVKEASNFKFRYYIANI